MFPITVTEIMSMAVITVVLGYIFADFISRPKEPFEYLSGASRWKDIKFASLVIAPAVIVHELFHKFVAMGFGLPAFFKVYWFGLFLGLALKMMHAPLLIIAPAYVIYPAATHFQNMLIAFAGPFANLLMWVGATLWLKYGKVRRKTELVLALTRKINFFLFVFNMIPLPPLDGYHFFSNLIAML